MNIDDFQKHALGTVAISQKDIVALSHRGFGLAGEAGNVSEILKIIIRDKAGVADDQDLKQIKKRLGDVLYYTAVLAEYFDLSLSEIAEQNMAQSTKFKTSRKSSK